MKISISAIIVSVNIYICQKYIYSHLIANNCHSLSHYLKYTCPFCRSFISEECNYTNMTYRKEEWNVEYVKVGWALCFQMKLWLYIVTHLDHTFEKHASGPGYLDVL